MLTAVAPLVSFVPTAAASARRVADGTRAARLANRWSSGAWALRLAVGSSVWTAVAAAAAMVAGAREDPELPVGLLVVRALGVLSWINGVLVGWALAGELRRTELGRGVASLIAMRGYAPRTLDFGRGVSAAMRIAVLTGGPGLVLCGVAAALSPWLARAPWLALLLVGTVAYALVLGGAVAWLVSWSVKLAPRHALLVLAAVVFGPCLADYLFGQVPTLPGLFAWLLRGLALVGVAA
jgi:hypothetical protein